MPNQYKNITISGLPGCGSTTLLHGLKDYLQFHGWTGFSGGAFMRAYAIEKGFMTETSASHHDANTYPDDFDRQVDFDIRQKLQTQHNWIIESWLSGFFAQGIEDNLKILMICTDPSIRIDRIANRDSVSMAEAKRHITGRYETNLNLWSKMYAKEWQEFVVNRGLLGADAPIDFWHPTLYDLVIDTYSTTKQESLNQALDAIGMKGDLV